jgi:hypothetical protein
VQVLPSVATEGQDRRTLGESLRDLIGARLG